MVSFRKYLYFWNGGWKKNLHNNRHFFEVLTARPPKQGILPMSFVIQLIEKAAHNTGVKKVFRITKEEAEHHVSWKVQSWLTMKSELQIKHRHNPVAWKKKSHTFISYFCFGELKQSIL